MLLSYPAYALVLRYNDEKAFSLIREAGFDAVDYNLCPMENPNDAFNAPDWERTAKEIRALAEKHGLVINQTHAPFHFSAAQWNDPVFFRETILEIMKRAIRITGLLGADVIVVHPIHHDKYAGHEEEMFARNMDYYRILIPVAEEAGVRIAVENMFQGDARRKCIAADTCSSSEEFIRYIDTLNSDRIIACLDVGHVGLVPQREEAWDLARALGHNRLHSLHIHDNDYRGDQHSIPYCGKIDWKRVTEVLGEIDYDGDFTYEIGKSYLLNIDEELIPAMLKYAEQIGRVLMKRIDEKRPKG